MAVDVARPPQSANPGSNQPSKGVVQGVREFLLGVRTEMKKVVWPDVPTVRQATIAIIIFVLLLGLVITILDWALSLVLVKGIPAIFAGR